MDIASRFRQFSVLCKHFFSRLFYNELLKFENQQREAQLTMLVLLAILVGFSAEVVYEPFLLFAFSDMTPVDIWHAEAFLLTFSMALAGILAVASWDKLFLDRLDQIHLRPLPVKVSTVFLGKLFSILAFVIAVTTAANLFATLIAAVFPSTLLDNPFICGWAHYAAIILGSLFVFMAVSLLHGLLLALLPPAFGKRAAVFVQMLLLFVFLSPFVWFPMLFHSLPALKSGGSALFRFFPPLWFTGIFNRILGFRDAVLDRAGLIGLLATALVFFFYLIVTPLNLRKYARDSRPAAAGPRILPPGFPGSRIFSGRLLRHPVQHAVFSFFMQTLRRSREHKLKLTMFLALPVSVLLSQFVYLYLKKGLSGGTLDMFLVSLPLTLHFFLLLGFRIVVSYPQTLEANFIFRVGETGQAGQAISGFKKALLVTAVLPPLLICLPLYLYFWEPPAAAGHTLYSLAVALLLLELFFFNFRKLPFACEHVPGKFKLRFYWPVLLLGYLQYYLTFSHLGLWLLKNPGRYFVFFPAAALLVAAVRIQQNRKAARAQLQFEDDEADPGMMSLGLD